MSDHPKDLEFKLQHLVIAVKDVITEWHDLGLHLGLPDSTLKLIGSSPDIEGHLRMMLSKWLDYDPEASWDKLANALNTMGKNTIAANIRSKYVKAVNSQTITGDSPASDEDETQARKCTVLQTNSKVDTLLWVSLHYGSSILTNVEVSNYWVSVLYLMRSII